jgi:hypothetical protein
VNTLVNLLILLLILAIVGGAGYFIHQKFRMPDFVLWIFGCVLMLILVIWLVGGGPRIVVLN